MSAWIPLIAFLLAASFCGAAAVYVIERLNRFYVAEMKRMDTILLRYHKLLNDAQDKMVSKDFTAYSAMRSVRVEEERNARQPLAQEPRIREGDIFLDMEEEQPLGPINMDL